jgi:integrase
MTRLRVVAEDYLRMRRALGYQLKLHGWQLEKFITYLEQAGAETVTIENAVAWATSAGTDPSYWAQRLSIVRQFARHLQALDPACEVPPAQLLPYRAPRAIPYLYEPDEIIALIRAASELEPKLLAVNYQTLIGLLAVTGMRVGEAIRLDRDDVDIRRRLLRIINSKFGKSRELVLHDVRSSTTPNARPQRRRHPQIPRRPTAAGHPPHYMIASAERPAALRPATAPVFAVWTKWRCQPLRRATDLSRTQARPELAPGFRVGRTTSADHSHRATLASVWQCTRPIRGAVHF